MSRGYLAAKVAERQSLTNVISGIYERAAADGERDLTESEQTQVRESEERAAKLDEMIESYRNTATGASRFMELSGSVREQEERAAIERAKAELAAHDHTETRQRRPAKSFGEQLVESEQFQAYNGRGAMEPVTFDSFVEVRAAITTDDLDIPAAQWAGPRQPALTSPMLGVCNRVQTSSGSVQWILWGAPSDAEVVEEGALKPEATFVPTPYTAELVTVAHWRAVTRQAMEDVPQIRSIVDGLLRRGVVQKLEADATAALTGSTDIPVVTADSALAGIRTAIGQVQAQGYTPDALVLNPADYAELDVDVMAGTQNGPVRSSNFWGLTPVPSNSIPEGEAYVGEFGAGLTWFDRGSTEVLITDSHADYFVRNMLVLLAETRAAFAVTEPLALAKVGSGS